MALDLGSRAWERAWYSWRRAVDLVDAQSGGGGSVEGPVSGLGGPVDALTGFGFSLSRPLLVGGGRDDLVGVFEGIPLSEPHPSDY